MIYEANALQGRGQVKTGRETVHIPDEKYEIVTQDDMDYGNSPPTSDLEVIVICHSERQ